MAEEATTTATETAATATESTASATTETAATTTAESTTQTQDTQAETKTEQTAKPVIPETYEFKVPEGFTLDKALVDKFTPIAKELGLTQDKAQLVADLFAEIRQGEVKAFEAKQAEWHDRISKDKDLGGTKLEATLKAANTALSTFATPDEVAELQAAGLANFPGLVRILAKAGDLMKEDTLIARGAPVDEDSAEAKAARRYPSMTKNP